MDINKEFENLAEEFEKEWHDGHEPQGIDDQYVEEMEDGEEVEIDEKFAGWIAFYNKDKLEIKPKKGVIDSLNDAKQAAIKHFKVPKSKQGLLAIEPAHEEVEAYAGTKKWKKGQNKMKKAGITLQKKDKFSGYVEDVEEASTYRDKARDDEKKKKRHFAFGGKKDKTRHGAGGYGKGSEEVGVDEAKSKLPPHLAKVFDKDGNLKKDAAARVAKGREKINWIDVTPKGYGPKESKIGSGDQESRALIATKAKMLMKKAIKSNKKQSQDWWNKQAKLAGLGEEVEKQTNLKEKTMDLEDTIKQVIVGEHKGDKPHKHPHEVRKEDTDKDEPGTQGDMAAYQKKRKAVAKKFGVKSCSELDGADKKACYAALDKAHVADHEEQVELEKMRKEDVSESHWKVNIPDMPPVFIEAGSASEIKKDMRKKLKPDVFKELSVERVSKSEMIKKYREMVKGDSGEEDPKEKEEETTISKMYGHVKTLMQGK